VISRGHVVGVRAFVGLLLVTAMVVVALSFGTAAAGAGTITVHCNNDGGSPNLQSAINSGSVVVINVSGTCDVNLVVNGNVTHNLTLNGLGGTSPTLYGGGSGPVLDVRNGATVTLKNLTVTHGGSEFGGGILIEDCNSVVNLISTTVTDNEAFLGGGVQVTCGTLNMTSSHVDGNFAFAGAGVGAAFGAVVNGNTSTVNGNETCSVLSGGCFDGLSGLGAGIAAALGVTINLKNSSVSDNGEFPYTPNFGGGILVFDTILTLTRTNVSGNLAVGTSTLIGGGGGIWMAYSYVLMDGSHVSWNESADNGGGIADYGGSFADAPKATLPGLPIAKLAASNDAQGRIVPVVPGALDHQCVHHRAQHRRQLGRRDLQLFARGELVHHDQHRLGDPLQHGRGR
jgi:hypothetical protein